MCSLSSLQLDNGLTHVSLKVSIRDTKHRSLFSLKDLLLLRFTTWSKGGV